MQQDFPGGICVHDRQDSRKLRVHGPSWQGRDGRGLSGQRPETWPRCGDQGPA